MSTYRKPRPTDARPVAAPTSAPSGNSRPDSPNAIAIVGGVGCLGVVLLMLAGGVGAVVWWAIPDSTSAKATQATYVYEKDDGAVPSPVSVALDKLNRDMGILATPFEEDTLNGNQEVPKQYRVALATAQKEGLPALVVQADAKVLKVIKKPNTEEEVLEAAGYKLEVAP